MEDVARAAGVHRTTVSLALRRHPRIPAATRAAILNVARQMDYRPNPLVAALMQQHRGRNPAAGITSMAYLTFDTPAEKWRANASYLEIHAGAQTRAHELGFKLEEFPFYSRGMNPRRLRQILLTRSIRGIILSPPPGAQESVPFDISDFAVIGIGLRIHSPLVERVSTDHYQAMRLALTACHERGYTRPGLVLEPTASARIGHRWEAAFLMEHWLRDLPAKPLILNPAGPRDVGVAPRGFAGWLRRHKPDVIITTTSDQGDEWRRLLRHLAPKAALVSLGLRNRTGALAGIWQNHHRLGGMAVELLASKLQRNETGSDHATDAHLVEGSWIDGKTLPMR
jgi:DNA-binding LacI/PurR family transcriptional regulator